MEERNPHAYLNFTGKLDDCIGMVMGPNTMGEYLTVITQDFYETADWTRLGLVYGNVVR